MAHDDGVFPVPATGGDGVLDVVLRGGWVVDGAGAPPVRADVGIRGSRIASVGRAGQEIAALDLDVTGRYVFPGLVDSHVHADLLAGDPDVQFAMLRQGVTTVVVGQDGVSVAPASAPTALAMSRYFAAVNGQCPPDAAGGSVADLLARHTGSSRLNLAYLAPAGTIRADVMGFRPGRPDAGQLLAMQERVETAMDDGAVGLSTGLEYVPGRFADEAELAALCAPVAEAGGVYVSHLRGYEAESWRGLDEAFRIGCDSGVAVHVSHLHGPANMITSLVDHARGDGVDVTFDSYPYLRGSSILTMVALPPDIQSGGPDETIARLADAAERARLAREWFPRVTDVLARITLSYVAAPEWAWVEGLSLIDAAARAGMTAEELVCELATASGLGAGCVFAQPPTNTDGDVRQLLRHEAHMAGSDGIYLGARPHPRGWGTFARLLSRHTRDLGDWTWAQAGVHLAGHPARRFGLGERGLVRAGMVADLAVVNPVEVADRSDYADPRRPADGVEHVLVAGRLVLRDGRMTNDLAGVGIRRTQRAGQGAQ